MSSLNSARRRRPETGSLSCSEVGDGVLVEGRLESNKWVDKDGNNRISWAITCDRIEFPAGKKAGSGDAAAAPAYAEPEDDEEIPF